MTNTDTFVPALHSQGKLERNAFSLCFGHGGGSMALGGSLPAARLVEDMVFIDLSNRGSFFGVTWLDLRIVAAGGSSGSSSEAGSIKNYGAAAGGFGNAHETIIDSGTTFTYIPTALQGGFKARWKELTGFDYQVDDALDDDVDIDSLPDLIFVFTGKDGGEVEYTVKPSAYVDRWCPYYEGHTDYLPTDCWNYLSINFEGSTKILGANFMTNHDVYFDTEVREVYGFGGFVCAGDCLLFGAASTPLTNSFMPSCVH